MKPLTDLNPTAHQDAKISVVISADSALVTTNTANKDPERRKDRERTYLEYDQWTEAREN